MFGLVLGMIAALLALGAMVPAFAADGSDTSSQAGTTTTTQAKGNDNANNPGKGNADNPNSDNGNANNGDPNNGNSNNGNSNNGNANDSSANNGNANNGDPNNGNSNNGNSNTSSPVNAPVTVQDTTTIQYTGQGTTDGACDTFEDPSGSPVSFDPATQQVWQFNLTDTSGSGATMSASFSDGTTVTNKPADTFTGPVAKWYIVTAKGATVVSASATFTPAEHGNPQFTVSHCWGDNTPSTGSLTVGKSVVGTPPGGASFTVGVDCNDGSSHDRTLTFDSTGALTGGGPLPITGIPSGTQCTVTETGTGGASSVTYSPGGANPPTVTIAADQQSSVTVTNTYNAPDTGSLQVQKITEGEVPPATSWQVTVTCTSPSFSSVLNFAPNDLGPKTVSNIPLSNGSNSCSVAETNQGNPPPTLVTVTPNSAQNVTSAITPLFTVINSYPGGETVGSVSVTKAVEGVPLAGAHFTVHVSCTDGTSADLTFGANGGTQQVNGIKIGPSGTNCTVTEPETGQASNVSFSPDDNGKFTLTVNSPSHAITVRNRFDPIEVGGISVTRGTASVVGTVVSGAPTVAGGTLPFTGSPTAMLLKVAAWLLGIGAVALLIARLRRRSTA